MPKKTMPRDDPELLARIHAGLQSLRLPLVVSQLDEALAATAHRDQSRLQWLYALLEPQIIKREENRIERRIRESTLPARKTLDAFDFAFQPDLDRDKVMELATLQFLKEGMNVLIAGWSGTGKSHIAMALALCACVDNRRVRYTTSEHMFQTLNASLADETLEEALKQYTKPELLIIDEVGMEKVERMQAPRSGLMQKVLFPRYHPTPRSTIITSNIPWKAWGEFLEDELGAVALLDRLIHHSHVIVIEGPSWRDHEHRQDVERRTGKHANE